eukprot:Protomagalhaensia_sp_Gyna_25__1076@NODE_1521_length_1765_cov_19_376593_g1235_i0_p1_GENE_NODE_1521_length_1765_cov_19_376593_g1235_i0NODE_1521_length_1765_cov_19_376593_g1235_i0_p1_ORF_typecomplete_len476_score50_56FAD_binding_4/PF01565_23/1_4e33BBE/PF08031_12/2_3e05PliI/PF16743_5/0_096_NODE_1521_length_1765_cov_19_376593_g1235_i0761503
MRARQYLLRTAAALGVHARDRELQDCLTKNGLAYVWRNSPQFEGLITTWNQVWISHPAVYLRPLNPIQVSKAVRCAAQNNRVVTARSGGHSYGGYSRGMNNGMVLDLRLMDGLNISTTERTVDIQPGIRLGRLFAELDAAGHFVVPGGSCPTVGATGHILGGGNGPLGPFYGVMADNVIALDVVLADGTITRIDSAHMPDLFAAMRGAGSGNFAIVTNIKMRIHHLPLVSWRLANVTEPYGQMVDCYTRLLPGLSPRLGIVASLKPGEKETMFVYVGPVSSMDAQMRSLEECLPSITSAASVESDSYLAPFGHYAAHHYHVEIDQPAFLDEKKRWVRALTVVGDRSSPQLAEVIDRYFEDPKGGLMLERWGGHINNVPPSAIAFPHRTDQTLLTIFVSDEKGIARESEVWGESLRDELNSLIGNGAYINMVDFRGGPHQGSELFRSNLESLRDIARKYDPHHRFDAPLSPLRLNS